MRLSILCFAAGVWLLQWQPFLPYTSDLALLAMASVILIVGAGYLTGAVGVRLRFLVPVGAFLLGFCWAGGMAQWRLADALAESDEGRDIAVVGIVAGLPQAFENGLRFEFRVEALPDGGAEASRIPEHLSLAWYRGWRRDLDVADIDKLTKNEAAAGSHDVPQLHVGERWRLTVRLKRPHGNVNPHGFDYEAWLLATGVRATGYVRSVPDNLRLTDFVTTPRE